MSSFSDPPVLYLPGFLSGENAIRSPEGCHSLPALWADRSPDTWRSFKMLSCLFLTPCTIPARLPERPEHSPRSPEGFHSLPALWADRSPDFPLKCRLFLTPCTIPARLPERTERSHRSPAGCRSSPALWADCSPDTWRFFKM